MSLMACQEQLHAALYAAARDLKSSTDQAQTARHWQEVLLSVPMTFQVVAEADLYLTAYGLRQICMQDSARIAGVMMIRLRILPTQIWKGPGPPLTSPWPHKNRSLGPRSTRP